MSFEYPLMCSESNLLLLHYFSGNATFEFVMVFTRWCLVLHNPSKSCLVLIPVKLYFIPKQSNLSLGVKVYKLDLYKLLSHLHIHIVLSCTYFAAKTLFFTLGDQQPHEYYWNCSHIFPCCWRGFHGFGRLLAVRTVVSVTVQRTARFGAEKSPGPEEIWDLLFAFCYRGYLSILLFRVYSSEDYSSFPGSVLESIM